MRKHRPTLMALAVLAAIGILTSLLLETAEPIFHGQPESYWITNIVYNGPNEQIEQWRSFGAEGTRMLTRYLDRGSGWPATYRNLYRRFAPGAPRVVVRLFPNPVDNRATR